MNVARRLGFAVFLLGLGFAAGALASPRDHLGKINGAIKHLEAARMSLAETSDGFGGHKARADQLADQALGELHQAVTWAGKH